MSGTPSFSFGGVQDSCFQNPREIPVLDERSRGAGVAVENVAVMSTEQFLQIEKALTKQYVNFFQIKIPIDIFSKKKKSCRFLPAGFPWFSM